MRDARPVKVLFHARGADPETAWCVPLPGKDQYRVNNILFLHQRPVYGDVIEAREGEQGLTFKRVLERSGRFTMIVDYARPADFRVLVKFFRSLEVESEGLAAPRASGELGRMYLAVPKRLAAKTLFELVSAKVPGLVGVHPRLGPRPPQVIIKSKPPEPLTLFDAVARNDLAALERASTQALQVVNERGLSLLFVATRDGRLALVRALLARGVDPNPRSKKELSALYAAAMRNRANEAKLLLEAGAKPERAKDRDGDVVLVVAAFRESIAVLRVLLKTGPSLVHLSHALLEAAGVGNVAIVKLLLKHGADPDLKTSLGNSARSIAKKRKRREVLALF